MESTLNMKTKKTKKTKPKMVDSTYQVCPDGKPKKVPRSKQLFVAKNRAFQDWKVRSKGKFIEQPKRGSDAYKLRKRRQKLNKELRGESLKGKGMKVMRSMHATKGKKKVMKATKRK